MGMDLVGFDPTNEVGAYFRRNIWGGIRWQVLFKTSPRTSPSCVTPGTPTTAMASAVMTLSSLLICWTRQSIAGWPRSGLGDSVDGRQVSPTRSALAAMARVCVPMAPPATFVSLARAVATIGRRRHRA